MHCTRINPMIVKHSSDETVFEAMAHHATWVASSFEMAADHRRRNCATPEETLTRAEHHFGAEMDLYELYCERKGINTVPDQPPLDWYVETPVSWWDSAQEYEKRSFLSEFKARVK